MNGNERKRTFLFHFIFKKNISCKNLFAFLMFLIWISFRNEFPFKCLNFCLFLYLFRINSRHFHNNEGKKNFSEWKRMCFFFNFKVCRLIQWIKFLSFNTKYQSESCSSYCRVDLEIFFIIKCLQTNRQIVV